MGEKNTISLLTSINGYLKAMSEQAKQNKSPEDVAKNVQTTMTKSLNQGSVVSGAVTQPKNKYGDVTISAAMMASLNALPTVILSISKLKRKDVEAFTKTLLAIQVTINKFAEGSKDIKGADNLVKVIKSLSDLEKVGLVKLAVSLKVSNTLGFAKALTKFVEGVSNAAKKAGKISKSDLNKLEAVSKNIKSFSTLTKGLALVMGTVIGMAVTIKAIGTGPILKSVGITLGVLTALSAIAIGIGILSKRMSGATKGLKDVAKFIFLMQGAVIGTLLIGVIAQKALPQILKGFAAVSGIIIGYTLIAALVSVISKISPTFKKDVLAISMMAGLSMGLVLGTLLIGYVAQEAWKDILIGFAAISGIILGYALIATLVSAVTKLSSTFKSDIMTITMMAGISMGLVLGTLLIGYVAQEAWKDILTGFAAISGVIIGYTALADVVSMVAKLSPTFRKDILSITMMAGISMGLVLGTLLMGCVAEEAWPDILAGFITTGLIITGFAWLGRYISTVTKGLGAFKQDFITLGIFAAECEALLLGTVAIAWVTKKANVSVGEVLLTIAGVGLIAEGLVYIARQLQASKIGSTAKAIAALKELSLIGFACEGLLAGVIGLAVLVKKADPVYIAGAMVSLSGVIYGLTKIIEYLEKHNKTLVKGAKNLLLVEGIALGAEAIMGGIIGLAILSQKTDPAHIIGVVTLLGGIIYGLTPIIKYLEKHNNDLKTGAKNLLLVETVALGAEVVLAGIILLAKQLNDKSLVTQIPITIGLITTIVGGMIGLTYLVNKNNKDLTKGAKSLLLLEGVALGAEVVLAGIIGIVALKKTAKVSDLEIGGVIVLLGGIITGLVGISMLVEKHNKNLQKGAKSFLLLEGVALGAEVVLAGIIGLIMLKRVAKVGYDDITLTLGLIGVIIGGIAGLAILVEKFKNKIRKAIPGMLMIDLFAVNAGVLLLGVIGLIALEKKFGITSEDVLLTVASMTLIIGGMGAIAILVGKFENQIKKAIPGMLMIDLFAVNAGALLLGVIGLVALQNKLNVKSEDILLAVTSMTLIVGGMGALAVVVGKFDSQVKKALPGIGVITLFALAAEALLAGVIGLVALKNKAKADWDDIFITVGAMATIVGSFGLLAGVVGTFVAPITAALPGVGVITLFALASEALLAGVIGLVALKNKVKANWSDIFITIGAMATIVTAFGVLGTAVGLATPFITLGLAGIGVITLFALSAEALLAGVIGLIDLKNKVKADWEDVFATIGAMTTLVGAFGLLGTAVGLATPLITLGLAGIGTITLFALASEALLAGVIELVALKNKVKADWEDIDKTISNMESIVKGYGFIGAAVGIAFPLIAPALLAVPSIISLAESSILILNGVIDLVDKKNKAKADWKDIDTTLDKIKGVITSYGFIGAAVGIASPLIAPALLAVPSILSLGESSVLILGGVIDLVDRKNKAKANWEDIDTTLDKMEGIITQYGVISSAASIALPLLLLGAPGLSAAIGVAKETTNVLGEVINVASMAKKLGRDGWAQIDNTLLYMNKIIVGDDKIPGFKQLCTSASWAYPFIWAGSKGLKLVAETAKITSKSLIEICKAADAAKGKTDKEITQVISYFDNVTDALYDIVGLRFYFKAKLIRSQKGYITDISIAAMSIADALAKMAGVAKEGGFMRTYHIKPNGEFAFGPWVNAIGAVSTITGTMSTFVDNLYESFKNIDLKSASRISNGVKMLQNIMEPISNFAIALSAFKDAGDGYIKQIKYDDKGKLIDTPPVKVADVALTIGNAISNFCKTLFSDNNQHIWENMTKGDSYSLKVAEGSMEQVYNPGNAGRAMGILATIIDPIANFTQTLAMFEDGGEGVLYVPIYDEHGNFKTKREIKVVEVATKIGNAVTTFIQTLTDKSGDWIELYRNYNDVQTVVKSSHSGVFSSSKEYETITNNVMKDAFGVFGNVIQPVVAFANILRMFGDVADKKGKLLVFTENGSREIDPKEIAATIGGAISSFIKTLTEKLNPNDPVFGKLQSNEDLISTSVDTLTKALESLGQIDTDNAVKFYGAFGNIMELVYSIGDEKHGASVKSATISIGELTTAFTGLNEQLADGNNIVSTLTSMNSLLGDISKSSGSLNGIISFFTDIKKHAENFSGVIDSSVIASISNLCSSIPKLSTTIEGSKGNINGFLTNLRADAEAFSNALDSSVVATITNLVSSLPSASNAIGELQGKFNKTVTDKKTGIKVNADKITIAFNKSTISIKNFDSALSGNNNKRINNLKNLKEAITSLNDATKGIESRLANVASALKALASISTENAANNISRVISALGNMHASGGSGTGGSGGGVSIDTAKLAKDLSDAIAAAFDGTEIRLKEQDDNTSGIKQIRGYLDVPGASESISNDYGKF